MKRPTLTICSQYFAVLTASVAFYPTEHCSFYQMLIKGDFFSAAELVSIYSSETVYVVSAKNKLQYNVCVHVDQCNRVVHSWVFNFCGQQ